MAHPTKQRLLDAGLSMLLQHGYHDLGIQALLELTETPKGSFYHHFTDKEDFALQVIDRYMQEVHGVLEFCLHDQERRPLERVRRFFEMTEQAYQQQGYMGCLLGGLGQELAGVNDVFRRRISECLSEIGKQLSSCLAEARLCGDLAKDTDCVKLGNLLVDCWEGAALRSRLRGDAAPLLSMLDFYFRSIGSTPQRMGARRSAR